MDQQEYSTSPQNANDLATITVFDFSENSGMQQELGLSSTIYSNSKLEWQSETCICDLGDLCNSALKMSNHHGIIAACTAAVALMKI